MVPFILAMCGFVGVYHPKVAAGLTITWVAGRFAYTVSGSIIDGSR
jgi:hypothetical protein